MDNSGYTKLDGHGDNVETVVSNDEKLFDKSLMVGMDKD